MVRTLKIGLLTLVAGWATGGAAETLLVYTAVEPEWLSAYKTAFEKAEPGLEVTFVRASAGAVAARLTAEKDAPKADVILGLSAIAMEGLRKAGLLEPYRPQGADAINPKMHAADWSWFGMNA